MRNGVKIIYSDYIPDELIRDFKSNLNKELNGEFHIVKNKHEYENFTGPEFSDIAIYIEQHITEIIISGVLGNAAFSAFKYSLIKLWAGFKALVKRNSIRDKGENQLAITLNLHDGEKEIEIIFEGDIDEKNLENIVDKAFDFLRSYQLTEAFKQSDNIENLENKPRIRLIYDEKTKKWEPANFGELRRKFDELRDWVSQNILD